MIRMSTQGKERSKAVTLGLLLAALLVTSMLMAKPAHATTFTVDSTADTGDNFPEGNCDDGSGNCTLREAIQEANRASDADTINFDIPDNIVIPGLEVKTISPNSQLPSINQPVTIDGYSQLGASENTLAQGTNAVLKIELNGSGAGDASGLVINAPNVTIKGLAINRFAQNGIAVNVDSETGRIEGNFVGTDPGGTTDRGNTVNGVLISGTNHTVGGTTPAARNLISGNGMGVVVAGTLNTVSGNLIGTGKDGTSDLGNGNGMFLSGSDNLITQDVIAFNDVDGVVVNDGATRNGGIRSDSIFSNGQQGIDLGDDGPTANDAGDADAGANNLQNFPVPTSAKSSGGGAIIQGTLNSTPNADFTIQLFSNPSGTDEGKTFVASKAVTTDASGDASFTVFLNQAIPVGEAVTAIAENSDDCSVLGSCDTSEFSAPVTVTANARPVANDDSYNAFRGLPLNVPAAFGVLANDSDPDGDGLTFVPGGVSQPANGTLSGPRSDGSFTYTPNPGFVGTDSFTYKVSDGLDEANAATVTITVNELPPPPKHKKKRKKKRKRH